MKLQVKVIDDVNAIPYLGESVVEKYPKLKSWTLPSRNNIDDLKLRTYAGVYHPLRNIDLQSIYPIPQGYQDNQALGLRMDLGDSLGVTHIASTFAYSPTGPGSAGQRDRFHVGLEANYWDWKLSAYLNKADFYDLFGPTKVGRRGYALTVEKSKNLLHDSDRTLDWTTNLSGYSGLDKLPDYQNIIATHTQVVTASSALAYSNLQKISRRNRRRKRYAVEAVRRAGRHIPEALSAGMGRILSRIPSPAPQFLVVAPFIRWPRVRQ